jgi:hypothetical protein
MNKYLLLTCLIVMLALTTNVQEAVKSAPYIWKNVRINGGGFVKGIIFHPTAKGVRYWRTDMVGAYSWIDDVKRWNLILLTCGTTPVLVGRMPYYSQTIAPIHLNGKMILLDSQS